jgi:hypothetical protein
VTGGGVTGGGDHGPAAAIRPPSFDEEIGEALAFERTLLYRGLAAVALVAVVVVVRGLFFA